MFLFMYFVLFHESSWLNLANTLDFSSLFLLCFKKLEALKGSRNVLIYLIFFLITHDLVLLPPAACFWGWHNSSLGSISPASSSVTPFLWMSSYVHGLLCGHPLLFLPAPLLSTVCYFSTFTTFTPFHLYCYTCLLLFHIHVFCVVSADFYSSPGSLTLAPYSHYRSRL